MWYLISYHGTPPLALNDKLYRISGIHAGGLALKPAIQDIDIVVTFMAMSLNAWNFYNIMFEISHLPADLLPSYIRANNFSFPLDLQQQQNWELQVIQFSWIHFLN